MARSLADLRAKPKQLPTRTVRICLDQEAVADVQRLDNERRDLLLEAQRRQADSDGERKGPPLRVGEGATPPRVAEIDAELEALFDRMRESEGDLLLRAVSGGEWQRFKDDNPAREGNKSDEETAYGLCDSAALLADLGRFVAAWNGETFGPDDWREWFAAQVAPADLSELCRQVVQLHEFRVTVPKAQSTVSSATAANGTGSTSPSPSESPDDDSSDGSPRSDTSTTTPTGT
jgi:hypothetical protein